MFDGQVHGIRDASKTDEKTLVMAGITDTDGPIPSTKSEDNLGPAGGDRIRECDMGRNCQNGRGRPRALISLLLRSDPAALVHSVASG